MKISLPGRPGKVHRGLFQYVTLLRDALEFSFQVPHFFRLRIDGLALFLWQAVLLGPGIQAVNADLVAL